MKLRKMIIFLLFAITIVLSRGNGATTMNDVQLLNKSLKSTNYADGTISVKNLFKAGDQAIPFLIENLDDTTPFTGLCGAKILDSQYTTGEKKYSAGQLKVPTIRDVSLYLIIAILKNDLYFASSCCPVSDDNSEERMCKACALIKERYYEFVKGSSSFSELDILNILAKEGIRFE